MAERPWNHSSIPTAVSKPAWGMDVYPCLCAVCCTADDLLRADPPPRNPTKHVAYRIHCPRINSESNRLAQLRRASGTWTKLLDILFQSGAARVKPRRTYYESIITASTQTLVTNLVSNSLVNTPRRHTWAINNLKTFVSESCGHWKWTEVQFLPFKLSPGQLGCSPLV